MSLSETDVAQGRSRAERIETLLQQIADLPDARVRAQMEELIQSLLDLFGDGLAHMLELSASAPAGDELISAFAEDDLIGSLLLLYGLHPDDTETRIARALEGISDYIEAQGAQVTLLGVVEGVASARLAERPKSGCAACSSLASLKPVVEQAIYSAAPELEGVTIEEAGATQPPKLITLTPTRRKTRVAGGVNGARERGRA